VSVIGSRFFSFAMAAAAIVYLCWMFIAGAPNTHQNLIKSRPSGVLEIEPEKIIGVDLSSGEATVRFAKQEGHWIELGPPHEALITPRQKALEQAVRVMHTATPVRVLRPEATASVDAKDYGLDPAHFIVRLTNNSGDLLTARFGEIGNDGILQYMRIDGSAETFLMSGFVGNAWRELLVASPGALETELEY
jgi:hypothetical protein